MRPYRFGRGRGTERIRSPAFGSEVVTVHKPVSVLIVEDNPDDVELAKEYLKRTSIETRVDSLDDGDKAIQLFERLEANSVDAPEFVLLDANMPGRRGREVLEAIRRRHDDVRVVMYSGSSSPDDMKSARELGADGYIVKPMLSKEMETVVAQLHEMLSSVQKGQARSGAWMKRRPASR